jgi:hypothetical protein
MTADVSKWRWQCLTSVGALLLCAAIAWAAEGRARPAKIGTYNAADQTVEMFAAIEEGDIAVKLIPKDSTECRVQIENKTKQPLNVKLPETFAAVPVLAQIGGVGGAGRRSSGGNSNSGGGNQSMGGGMGMGMGGMGGGMGMFNVPPEKVGRIDVATVCLEHGKDDPRPAIPYAIKPLESFTTKPGVRELCAALGNGQINQRAAQAAAWHLNNDMSWQELAAKQIHHANGTREPYFSPQEIQGAIKIAAAAVSLSEERRKQEVGTADSLGEK